MLWALVKEKNELYSFYMDEQDLSPAQRKKSDAILAAARTHFATRGFEATKLSEVAKDAGVAVGTIYLRYKSKAELLSGVLEGVELAFCQAMDTAEIWATPFPARFSLVASAVLDTAKRQSDLPALMALSAFAAPSEKPAKRPMIETICRHLQSGIETGALRTDVDPDLVAHMAHGMVEGGMRELMTNPNRSPQEVIDHIADAYANWLMK